MSQNEEPKMVQRQYRRYYYYLMEESSELHDVECAHESSCCWADATDKVATTDHIEYDDLKNILKTLSKLDQMILYRYSYLLLKCINNEWIMKYSHLDLRCLELEIEESSDLCYFLHNVVQYSKRISFTVDRMHDYLNLLEISNVRSFGNVKYLYLYMPTATGTTAAAAAHNQEQSESNGTTIESVFSTNDQIKIMQWPFYALPRLICNVRYLEIHCDVRALFIEQFHQLRVLILYGCIGQSALTGIFTHCDRLERLIISQQRKSLELRKIEMCQLLVEISMPLVMFCEAREQIMLLPHLEMLELSCIKDRGELAIFGLRYLLDRKADNVRLLQIRCDIFSSPMWIPEVGLYNCNRLHGLLLANCRFLNREIHELYLPPVHGQLILNNCLDLKEYHLLDIMKLCYGLGKLYLINCPELNNKVLHDIYYQRLEENNDKPLKIVISNCESLSAGYYESFAKYWCQRLQIIRIKIKENLHFNVSNIQIHFHKT